MGKILLIATVFLFACSDSGNVKTEKTKEDPNLPPPNVSLPDPPPADAFKIQEKNPDGTFRVEGLIHNREDYLGTQVSVSGLIVKMSGKCNPKKAKKEGKTCPEPNLYIRDNADAEKFLRIVGYDEDFLKRAKIKEGETHVFKGMYKKVAQGFVVTEDGLILLDYLDDIPVILPQ